MIPFPDFKELLVMTPMGQMSLVGYYISHTMGSRLHPDKFPHHIKRMVICEGVEYGPEGQTRGLKLETFELDQVTLSPFDGKFENHRLEDMEGYDTCPSS